MLSIANQNTIGQSQTGGAGFSNVKSILLDGVDEYINVDGLGTALASTTVGTWSFWIKPVDATPTAIEKLITFGDTNGNEWIQSDIQTSGILTFRLRRAGGNKWDLRTDAAPFSDGAWCHVAFVQDGVSPVIYIDGVAVAQTFSVSSDKTEWFNNMAGLDNGRVGCIEFNSGGNTNFFNGNFDEVLFVNRALTQPQVADIYNTGSPKDETAITNGLSQYRFDGDTVPTCTDAIGSNNGTYVNIEQSDIENDVP